jgi:hypothetical protein
MPVLKFKINDIFPHGQTIGEKEGGPFDDCKSLRICSYFLFYAESKPPDIHAFTFLEVFLT